MASGQNHVITNSIFYSAVKGGADGVLDSAIAFPPLTTGTVEISNNYFTGAFDGAFSGASWGRGVWFDGGGINVSVAGNTFEFTRTGINLDMSGDSVAGVAGNTFITNGTGTAVGIDFGNVSFADNNYEDTRTEFDFSNVTTDVNFDAEVAVATVTPINMVVDPVEVLGGTGNDTLLGTAGADFLDANGSGTPVLDNDTLQGRGGNDLLLGRNGDDVLEGGANDDFVDGGLGVDRAVFSGARAQYRVDLLASGSILVTDLRPGAPDGVDTVRNCENFVFSDVILSAAAVLNDLPVITSDGGGATASRSVPENTVDVTVVTATDPDPGTVLTFSISGGDDAGSFQIDPVTGALSFIASPNFEAPTDADTNNSYVVQVQASDAILTATQTITVSVTDLLEPIGLTSVPPSDFNGDAVSDVLWRHTNGFVSEWLMSGGAIGQNFGVAQTAPVWHFQDTGDFGGDGKSDVLWRHDSGQVVLWQMGGATILSNQSVAAIGNDWHNEGVADFNGDERADVLWHNDSGQVVLWTMDGAQITNNQQVGIVDASSWHFQGLLDTGGDGKSDVLLRNDSGQVVLWTMDGAQITANQSVTNISGSTGTSSGPAISAATARAMCCCVTTAARSCSGRWTVTRSLPTSQSARRGTTGMCRTSATTISTARATCCCATTVGRSYSGR